MIEPNTSCRYALVTERDDYEVVAVHAIDGTTTYSLALVSHTSMTPVGLSYSKPRFVEWSHIAAMAPNYKQAKALADYYRAQEGQR